MRDLVFIAALLYSAVVIGFVVDQYAGLLLDAIFFLARKARRICR